MQKKVIKGGFALDIGNTKTHGQVRDANHNLVKEWTVSTPSHPSLADVIQDGYRRAQESLGAEPQFVLSIQRLERQN